MSRKWTLLVKNWNIQVKSIYKKNKNSYFIPLLLFLEKKDKIEEKTELGISKEVEEIFQNLMTPERILESEIVCDRWLKLIDEVKEIYLAVSLPCFFWKSDNYSHSENNCMF